MSEITIEEVIKRLKAEYERAKKKALSPSRWRMRCTAFGERSI